MRKLFQRVIAVVLCLSLLNNIDFSAFAKVEGEVNSIETVSQNESVSDNNAEIDSDIVYMENLAVPMTLGLRDLTALNGQDMLVTVNHYLDSVADDNMIFAPKEYTDVDSGDSINNVVRESAGFDIKSVTVYDVVSGHKTNGTQVSVKELLENKNKLEIASAGSEMVIDVVYEETTDTYVNGVSMFDYDNGWSANVNASQSNISINNPLNYDNYSSNKTKEQEARKARMGTTGVASTYKLEVNPYNGSTVTVNANECHYENYTIVTGLLTNLSGDKYENVNFKYEDPGFFSDEAKIGKTIIDGYKLEFERDGMHYTLDKVLNPDGKAVTTNLDAFFPLNTGWFSNNEFFGMRYDFTFTLGDYIGDMEYSFVGDDDVWVCLDGEVILDLGGIHPQYPSKDYPELSYAPGSVDVWEKLFEQEDFKVGGKKAVVNQQNKIDFVELYGNKTYTVTVLYMERGGNQSSCHMDFVMPNVVAAPPVVTSTASLPILKVDADTNNALEGVEFSLSLKKGSTSYRSTTDVNGNVTFAGLTAGEYTLTEISPKEGYLQAGPWTVKVNERTEGNVESSYIESISPELSIQNGYYVIKNQAEFAALEFTKVDSESGEALDGAKFQLVNKEGTAAYNETVTSGENGVVKFEKLSVGEYTLTETEAPDGYVALVNSWDVVVVAGETGVSASIVDLEKNDAGKYIIENATVESVIDYSKTAKLLSEEDRTYVINLSAETESIQVQGQNKAVDTVLTIDNSRSMLFPAELTEYKGSLKTSDVYYYYEGNNATVMVVWYANGNWRKMDSSEWIYHGSDSKSYNVSNNDKDSTYTISNSTNYYTSEKYTSQLTAKTSDVVDGIDPKNRYSNMYDRMQVLKSAVATFLDELKEDSPNSKVAVVTFGGASATNKTSGLTSIDNAKSVVAGLQISKDGGTPTDSGLATAKTIIGASDKSDKFVVLISDGLQTTGGSAADQANAIKKNGAKIISLGLNISNVGDAEKFLKGLSSDGTVLLADNAAEVVNALGVISGEITQSVTLNDVQIVDYIDSRFEITEDSKKALIANGAVVDEAAGTVTWNLDVLNGSGWNGEIIVKAKSDFLGGDEVPTNGPESGISVSGKPIVKFPIPQVDVRLLDLTIAGGETTVFIQDEIVPTTFWTGEVEDTLKSQYIDSSKEIKAETALAKLSEAQINDLFADGTCTVPYSYGDIQFGNLVYTVAEAPLNKHTATALGNPFETYKFTVTYKADNRTDASEKLFGEVSTDCEYKVNVVAGQIKITKEVDSSQTELAQGDPIFTFEIKKDGNFYAYKTVRFTSETDSEKSVVLDKLPRGEYEVVELGTMRYECAGIDAEPDMESNYQAYVSGEEKIEIGYDKSGSKDNNSRDAVVTVTNNKVNDKNFSDTDVVVNSIGFENGKLVWKNDATGKDYLGGDAPSWKNKADSNN